MDAKNVSWKLFEKTGSPAAYMFFNAICGDERKSKDDGRETERALRKGCRLKGQRQVNHTLHCGEGQNFGESDERQKPESETEICCFSFVFRGIYRRRKQRKIYLERVRSVRKFSGHRF